MSYVRSEKQIEHEEGFRYWCFEPGRFETNEDAQKHYDNDENFVEYVRANWPEDIEE